MSTYVISLLIQLRSTIPPAPIELPDGTFGYGQNMTSSSEVGGGNQSATILAEDPSLLSSLPDFRVFGRLFDVMFLVAATLTLIVRYIGYKMNSV